MQCAVERSKALRMRLDIGLNEIEEGAQRRSPLLFTHRRDINRPSGWVQ